MDNATERAGMLLVQVERFMRVLASVVQQVNFYLLLVVQFSPISFVLKNSSDLFLPVRDYIFGLYISELALQDI